MVWSWIKKAFAKILFVSLDGLKPIIADLIRKEQEKAAKLDPEIIADQIIKEIEKFLFKSNAVTPEETPPAETKPS